MLDAGEIMEEYMKYYECSRERAIEFALEDIDLARRKLIEESIKISEESIKTKEAQNDGS